MRFTISGDRVQMTTGLREHIDRRLCFSLGRFDTAIDKVSVRVGDINGPRGGIDKRCRIVVALRAPGGHPITVDGNDEDLHAAVARASKRAGQATGPGKPFARDVDRKRCRKTYQRRRMLTKNASLAMRYGSREDLSGKVKDHGYTT
ncbi:MAG TPA: HPF/RaiA family ribosome-associated protein [Thermoguttaceae bacterium]|nr:HPF/RaiA family ribosome-associated protein [Thermoguttaceae bacterium]